MNRKEFLQLSSAIIGGLAIHQIFGRVAFAQKPTEDEVRKDHNQDSYLAKGLTGMARADGWFDAHWGAAVLAGHYLCQENELGEETTAAIKAQLNAMIELRKSQFEPYPEEPASEELIAQVPRALLPALQGGLRAHGHAVIFASLSMRALRDAPHLAQPKLIEGLCGLSRQIARIKPQPPPDNAPYANTQSMIEATFDSLARFKGLLGRPSVRRPNFTHMTTHTEALMNLESMGYGDLARAGHAGHKAHISAPVPSMDPVNDPVEHRRATLEDLMNKSYWQDDQNTSRWNKAWNESGNPNGYWVAFGHLFKVLYSYHRLIDRIEDKRKVQLCSMILLERYINPEVRGG